MVYNSIFSYVSEIKFRWEGAALELRTTYLVDVADVAVRSGSEQYAVGEAEDATKWLPSYSMTSIIDYKIAHTKLICSFHQFQGLNFAIVLNGLPLTASGYHVFIVLEHELSWVFIRRLSNERSCILYKQYIVVLYKNKWSINEVFYVKELSC